MENKLGGVRPRTGRKPNFIVRMNPDAAAAARQSARDAGKQVGQWLEEAIAEKQEREKEAGNITKADSGDQPRLFFLHGQ